MKTTIAYAIGEPTVNAGKKTLALDVYDIIGDFYGEGVSARNVADVLRQHPDAAEIRVRINSLGGVLADAKTIKAILKDHPATVTVDVDGVAASAATVIMAAGDRVRVGRGNAIMIHEASNQRGRTEADHLSAAEELRVWNSGLADMYAECAASRGKETTRDQFRAWMAQEKWFTAQQAVDVGLADEVSSEDRGAAVAAHFDLTQCNSIPGWVAQKLMPPEPARTESEPMRTTQTASAHALNVAAAAVPVLAAQENQDPSPAPSAPAGNKEPVMQNAVVLAALNLSEGATDSDILSAVNTLKSAAEASSKLISAVGVKSVDEALGTVAALRSNLSQSDAEGHGKVLAALGVKSADEALGTIGALLSTKDRLAVAEAKLDEFKAQQQKSERDEVIAKLEAEGKCTPVQKTELFPKLSIDGLKAFAATAVPILRGDGKREPKSATKAYKDMTNAERVALHDSDPELFNQLRNESNGSL